MPLRGASVLLALSLSIVACSGPSRLSMAPKAPPAPPIVTALAPPPSAPIEVADAVRAPVELVTADGQTAPLTALSVRTKISDPVASTELTLRFEHPGTSTEARLSLALPGGAVVDRLASRGASPAASSPAQPEGARYDEAQVVERPRMRATYDEVLAARTEVDRSDAPFVALVGGLEPGAPIELVVTYHEVLPREGYRLPLRGLEPAATVAVHVEASGAAAPLVEIDRASAAQASDLVIPEARYRPAGAIGPTGVLGGDVMVVRVPAEGPAPKEAIVSPLFLCDTSAARAFDLSREVAALAEIVRRLPPDTEITIAAFDQDVVPVYKGRAGAVDERALSSLRSRRALGASDLSGALGWVGRTALAGAGLHHRLVVLGDGRPSAGERDPQEIARVVRELGAQGIDRIDAVAFGDAPGTSLLRALTGDASLPSRGVVVSGASSADEIERKLTRSPMSPLEIVVEGARSSAPQRLEGAVAGDEVVVVARVPRGSAPLVHVGNHAWRPTLRDVPPAELSAIAAARDLEAFTIQPGLTPEAKRQSIVARSIEAHVPSAFAGFTLHAEASASPFARRVALDLAWRAKNVELVDEPPRTAIGAEAFDPIDDRIEASPHVARIPALDAREEKAAPDDPEPPVEVAASAAPVPGRLPSEIVQRVVRLNHGRFKGCYERALGKRPKLEGRVVVKFEIDRSGAVVTARDDGSEVASPELRDCVVHEFLKLEFPAPLDERVVVRYPLVFSRDDTPPPPRHIVAVKKTTPPAPPREPEPHFEPPYVGRFATVMKAIASQDREGALREARAFQAESPDDVVAYLALGEAAEASLDAELAARAYGSILALWSYRADLVRVAGERLSRLGEGAALRIARDAFALARDERPDQPLGHRLLAFAEYRVGRPEEAFRTLERAMLDNGANDRFLGARSVLASDLGLLGAAFARSAPERRAEIERRTKGAGGRVESEPSLRAVLVWETNSREVDLHVDDANDDHASRKRRSLGSGGELTAGIVDGYGPEAFVFPAERARRAYPYAFRVVCAGTGPMGLAPGSLQIVEHDGKGHLTFVDKPFVVMGGLPGIELGDLAAPAR